MNDASVRQSGTAATKRRRQRLNRSRSIGLLITGLILSCLMTCHSNATASEVSDVQYSRDVRPILSEKCFHCHGPDAAARQADLRLDRPDEVTADRGGYRVIEPGKPTLSVLLHRVTSDSDDERMPPADSGVSLTAAEIEILRRWIEEGARYQRHWSFIPPQRPDLPATATRSWPQNAIDRFVLRKLERHQLEPRPPTAPSTLIRRISLDLTGLPPSLNEIDEFERRFQQDRATAVADLVDRLLKSPRYGEQMAVSWLDAARYADTNGYFTDNDRTMWPWRDWVINAFNSNMPFDQFTIEQLAGDLIADATPDQKIATGFNRNHMVNNETGIIEEEFRVEYVADRTDTTATVWMGLTFGCARCHDHKYDPISQYDYYRLFAFFNNVPERGLSGSSGNSSPTLKVPVDNLQRRLDEVLVELAAAEQESAALEKRLAEAQAAWEADAITRLAPLPESDLVAHLKFDSASSDAAGADSESLVEGFLDAAVRLNGDGCVRFDGEADFEHDEPFSIGSWVLPESAGCVFSRMDDVDDLRGFDVTLRKSKVTVNLVHRWKRNSIQLATTSSLPTGQWHHLLVTYDGSSQASGLTVYINGRPQPVEVFHDNLTGSIRNAEPFRIGRRQSSASLTGLVDEVRIYGCELDADEVKRLADTQMIYGILSKPDHKRSPSLKRKLRSWFIANQTDEQTITMQARLERLRQEANRLKRFQPTTMIMDELNPSRSTFVLLRGEYDQPGQKVSPGLPEFRRIEEAARTAKPASLTRQDLAEWLVSPANPLTARVTVNRIWQQLFGVGIVKTPDDFGTQGDWPSHPDLLDWLAVELVGSGWDLQHILKLIVSSATYQQSSDAPPESFAVDPENRLLARGPRFRMNAEMLRDNALAISGLLVEKAGGPSVKPYQPAGLWKEVTYDADSEYVQDTGESLYRRSLYTFRKRQAPPPSLLTFDAPTRETCTVQRSRTNTPLQALVLMNDPTFIEAARHLGERVMRLPHSSDADRVASAFRAATARRPTAAETGILLEILQAQKAAYRRDPNAALDLLSVGESERDHSLTPADAAAWTTVASTILSLDETITVR